MKLAVIALLIGPTANAQTRVDVEVGEAVTVAAGNAIGWFCDDPWLVDATLVTHGNTNDWVVTGTNVGTTQCRIGTELGRATFVVEVHVTPKHPTSR